MKPVNGHANGNGAPPVPDPSIWLLPSSGSSVTVNTGQSATVQLSFRGYLEYQRVTMTAGALPAGVTASFAPDIFDFTSKNNTQQVSLTLRASAAAAVGHSTIEVRATAADGPTATASIGVAVSLALNLAVNTTGQSTQSTTDPVTMAAYGTVATPTFLDVAPGVTGSISLALTAPPPPGVTAQFEPPTFTAPASGGTLSGNLVLTAGVQSKPGTNSISFAAKVGSATKAVYTFPLVLVPPFVSGVSPSPGLTPMLGNGGPQVKITGGGFGPGTTVRFGADTAVPAASVGTDGTSLVVGVPPTAASGLLVVTSPAGVASLPDFAIDNYRNTRGFSWANSAAFQNMVGGSFSSADATALFGASQTVCNFFGINLLAPFVDLFLLIANGLLDSGGQCFGMSLASLKFITGQMGYAFPLQPQNSEPGGPAGPNVWMLNGPQLGGGNNVSPSLASYVHQQHLAQLSWENISNWLSFHVSVNSAAKLRSAIQQAFGAGGCGTAGAILCLDPNIKEGHAVVAYGIVDTGGGNFDILVYNPNQPFTADEDSSSSNRSAAAGASRIRVTSNGSWSLDGPGTPNWSGGISNITVVPWNTIPSPPTIPLAELAGLVALVLWLVTGDATVTQVSDGQGHVLLNGDQWNTDPNTLLSDARAMPAFGGLGYAGNPVFISNRSGSLTHTVSGNAAGIYDLQLLGIGYGVKLASVPTTAGANDTVVMSPGKVAFTADHDKAVSATVTATPSTSQIPRTATLKTSAWAGATVGLAFDPVAQTFSYSHAGPPANYTLEISSFDPQGKPATFNLPASQVAAGATVTVLPDWTQLAAGAGTLSIRFADGSTKLTPMSTGGK
jgi:hypothetical protein